MLKTLSFHPLLKVGELYGQDEWYLNKSIIIKYKQTKIKILQAQENQLLC